jgi:2-polyprenyl-3-methyl-5-hydroxy-6-metoxy-1,4-benzoquinol methylase
MEKIDLSEILKVVNIRFAIENVAINKIANIPNCCGAYVAVFISGLRGKVVDFTNPGSGSRILDVATGTGKQAFAFAKKGYDVIGVDLSEAMLKSIA